MSSDVQGLTRDPFAHLFRGAMSMLAFLVFGRLVLELVGVIPEITRFMSSTVGLFVVAIYVAAVGPLHGGLRKFSQQVLSAFTLAAWTEMCIILATFAAAMLHLTRTHFAKEKDFGSLSHLGFHLLQHTLAIGVLFIIVLLLMMAVHVLWRWPVSVAPGAMLGVFVIMRFWTEAMGLAPWRAAAWSSTTLLLVGAIYLGGVGARIGLTEASQLLAPSLVLGWVWRFWVYLATVLTAYVPFFTTHFFDRSRGDIPMRLLKALGVSVIEGFIVGLLLWGIAIWIACVTRGDGTLASSDN
jgi:hypothetical protein